MYIQDKLHIYMKRITEFITKIFTQQISKPLGRWNIDYCSKKLDRKIDLSNEDHCGPCGQYRISQICKSELHNVKVTKPNIPPENNRP